jgi:hypothetical protein
MAGVEGTGSYGAGGAVGGGRRGHHGAVTARRVAIPALMVAGRSARQERIQASGQARTLIMTGPQLSCGV